MLRSMRPLELPAPEPDRVMEFPSQMHYSPLKDMNPAMMQAMFQKLFEENARLWTENQKLTSGFGILPLLLVDRDMDLGNRLNRWGRRALGLWISRL